MNIELQELGTTFAVGVFVIFAVDYLLNPLAAKPRFPLSTMLIRQESPIIPLVIAAVAALTLGILVDRLSDNVAGSLPFVPTETDIRSGVLFERDGSLTDLGADAHTNGLLNAFGYLQNKDLEDIADESYYHAKNVVYTYPTLFDELSGLQVRIAFIRSFGVASLVVFILAVPLRLLIPPIYGHIPQGGYWLAAGEALAFLALAIGAAMAYVSEEQQFDRRVYGYYRSLVAAGTETLPQSVSPSPPASVSGLTAYKDANIAVVDKKDLSSPRVFWLAESRGVYSLAPINVDWGDHRIPTDLEAVCAHGDDIWVAESSYWQARYPRLLNLHFERTDGAWRVREAVSIETEDFNIEGIECLRDDDGQWWFLIADRGHGQPRTTIVRHRLDREQAGSVLTQVESIRIASPLLEPTDGVRHVSDLAVLGHTLVAVATRDGGDLGPFQSVVFSLGCVGSQLQLPQDAAVQPHHNFDTVKIEGLAQAPDGNAIVLGADNEHVVDAPWLDLALMGELRPDCANQEQQGPSARS